MNRQQLPVVVIGAGMSGLVAALELARHGVPVTVLDGRAQLGGKIDQTQPGARPIDVGPTVLTMRWVFDELFASAGSDFEADLQPEPLSILARNFWPDGSQLDLHTDMNATADAIGNLCGAREARGYRSFHAYCERLYNTVHEPFILGPKPTVTRIMADHGLGGMLKLGGIDAFRSMHRALRDFFRDPRLLQLFGRYATYHGGSPFSTPATLNLIAHVEQQGVWRLPGGMHGLATQLGTLAQAHGATLRCGAPVARICRADGAVSGVRTRRWQPHRSAGGHLQRGPGGLAAFVGHPSARGSKREPLGHGMVRRGMSARRHACPPQRLFRTRRQSRIHRHLHHAQGSHRAHRLHVCRRPGCPRRQSTGLCQA